MKAPDRILVVLAAIAFVQGAALVGYALYDVVEAIRSGITGPSEVSNPMALIMLIVITAALGAGMVVVGLGWWRAQRWARAPFVMAQVIVALLGYDLAQATGSVVRAVGVAAMVMAALGLVLSLAPATGRAIGDTDPPLPG
jgi:hypothetical protein